MEMKFYMVTIKPVKDTEAWDTYARSGGTLTKPTGQGPKPVCVATNKPIRNDMATRVRRWRPR